MKNLALLSAICFSFCAATVVANDQHTLQFGENQRPLTFPNNSRPLNFAPAPIAYPAPQYSLDSMPNHPLNSAAASTRGHASQSPGTAKWYRPGFGYQTPYGSSRLLRFRSFNPYNSEYANGIRRNNFQRNDSNYRYWTNAYGGPWYFPGSTTNTQASTFSW